jgi:hypothetical protein
MFRAFHDSMAKRDWNYLLMLTRPLAARLAARCRNLCRDKDYGVPPKHRQLAARGRNFCRDRDYGALPKHRQLVARGIVAT